MDVVWGFQGRLIRDWPSSGLALCICFYGSLKI